MSRRSRRKNNLMSSPMVWGGVILIGIVALVALFNLLASSISNNSPCGDNGEDPDKPGYCLTSSKDFDELVVVTGNTQNSPEPNLDFSQGDLKKWLLGVFYNTEEDTNVNVPVISVSGDNRAIDHDNDFEPAKNLTASNNELKKLGKELNSAIKESPSDSGADYLGAIMEASRLFPSSAKNPLIIVVGSGLSDSGLLNFASEDFLKTYWGAETE